MTELAGLLETVRRDPRCTVLPPRGLPVLEPEHRLPTDVDEFYSLCGGITFFADTDWEIEALPPEEVTLANPVIVGERVRDDRSDSWYVIFRTNNGDYLTIDFGVERPGACYDSYYELHGVVGSNPIIAMSFTELVGRIYASSGSRWYWTAEDFASYGDAYD